MHGPENQVFVPSLESQETGFWTHETSRSMVMPKSALSVCTFKTVVLFSSHYLNIFYQQISMGGAKQNNVTNLLAIDNLVNLRLCVLLIGVPQNKTMSFIFDMRNDILLDGCITVIYQDAIESSLLC